MKYQQPSLSVILPCYNEAKNIRRNIEHIHSYLAPRFKDFEIIIVNDGSTDDTLKELREIRDPAFALKLWRAKEERGMRKENTVHIINLKHNHGKGSAVKMGMLKSRGEIVMFMDADLAIPIEETGKFVRTVQSGFDLAIASRFAGKIKILKPILWYRSFMEKIFRVLRMIVINNYDVQDTQCGFKMFKREAAFKIFPLLVIKRFSFDVEVVFLAKKFGLKIKELPITLQNPQESHIRLITDSWIMFWDLFKIRWNEARGRYKIMKHKT